MLYAILDRVVDDYGPVLAGLAKDIDEIETEVFGGDAEVSRRTAYGMNFVHMPELNWVLGYPFALGLMQADDTVGRLRISPLGTLKLASSIRGDAFTRIKRAAAVRFLTYFASGALRGMTRPQT